VESILRQMAEGESGGDCRDSSSSSSAAGGAGGGDLSVSGLVCVLVARFNSLFRRATAAGTVTATAADAGGRGTASADAADGDRHRATMDRATTVSNRPAPPGSNIEGGGGHHHQSMALAVISVGPSSIEDENERHHPGTTTYAVVSWGAASYLLGVIRDALLLSGNARDDLRWWFYRSRHSFGSGGGEGGGAGVSLASHPGAEVDAGLGGMGAAVLHPRIEGWTATSHPESRIARCRPAASGRHSNDWDPPTMTQPFNLFFELLVGMMKGNLFDRSQYPDGSTVRELSDSESECALIQLIQLKAIDLVSALMSDAPPYDHDDATNRTPYLWKFWFDSLIPSVRSTGQSSDVLPIGDFLSPWEDKRDGSRGNHMIRSGRVHSARHSACSHAPNEQQNKRGAEKQGRASNKPPRGDSTSQSSREYNDGNSKPRCHLSILVKDRILRLLSHFVLSSSSVNQSLYRIVDGDTKTSLAKRILSAVLDQIDEYIVPYLSSGHSPDKDRAAKLSADQCLRLCSCCVRFLLIMSRSNEGIRMLRSQMRLESEEDEPSRWSRSSIGCMTAVLDGTLFFAMQIEEMEDTELKSAGVARALTSIVDQCIAFFKTLHLFVERQRETSLKSATFLALTSEHRTTFRSCCQRILAHQSPNKVSVPPHLLHFSEASKYDARYLLEVLVIDAEKEHGDE
jgi:hypothetical protein